MSAKTAPPARQNLFELERAALHDLIKLVELRATASSSSKTGYAATVASAEKELARTKKQIASSKERESTALTESHQSSVRQIAERHAAETNAADSEYAETKKRVTDECVEAELKARTVFQDARWTADSLFEAAEKESTDDRENTRRNAAATAERVQKLWSEAEVPLSRAGLDREEVEVPTSGAAGGLIVDPAKTIEEQFALADQAFADLRDSRLLKLANVAGFFVFLVPMAILGAVPSMFFEEKIIAEVETRFTLGKRGIHEQTGDEGLEGQED